LGASLAHAHFKPGSNFCDDEKERHDTCKPLVSQEGCGCSRSSSSSSSSHSKGGSSEDGSDNTGEDGSGSWEGSGSGSGNSSGSWENRYTLLVNKWNNFCFSGSGSGSLEHPGSGSGVESGEWEDGEYCFILQVFLNYSIILDIEIRVSTKK
jgi:hypothetical protein